MFAIIMNETIKLINFLIIKVFICIVFATFENFSAIFILFGSVFLSPTNKLIILTNLCLTILKCFYFQKKN